MFWKHYLIFWIYCWRDPFWYIFLLLFVIGPVALRGLPWWAFLYIPAIILLASVGVTIKSMGSDNGQ